MLQVALTVLLSMPFFTKLSIVKGENSLSPWNFDGLILLLINRQASNWSADRLRSANANFSIDANRPEIWFTGEMVRFFRELWMMPL